MHSQSAAHFDAFLNLIAQITPVELAADTVSRDSNLASDLMLDSISLISLMALTEEHFGISFAEHTEAIAKLATVGDALDLIESLQAASV